MPDMTISVKLPGDFAEELNDVIVSRNLDLRKKPADENIAAFIITIARDMVRGARRESAARAMESQITSDINSVPITHEKGERP